MEFDKNPYTTLPADTNQARGIGQFAIDCLSYQFKGPDKSVLERVKLFHTDSVICGLSALALQANAPKILRDEAMTYPSTTGEGATVFGSAVWLRPEKACLANAAAAREWDSNGTVFGYNPRLNHTAGEFGHNDFYGVAIAGCQVMSLDGSRALLAMVVLDEIRGRLCEVFSLKSYKIDHVVHGAIASAAVYGALVQATAEQIEMAIGMVVSHYVPYRAIRAGTSLSDSKGASAALSTEMAIMSVERVIRGFIGPQDIFRNPEALFRLNEPTEGNSPFSLVLTHSGSDYAVMGMHFKLGLYEHQSAGAIQAVINILEENPHIIKSHEVIQQITITIYEPAFGIIGHITKSAPVNRQSADHSMKYIIGTLIRKAIDLGPKKLKGKSNDKLWQKLILTPYDYAPDMLNNKVAKDFMTKIEFRHGGQKFDDKYPEGIPTQVVIDYDSDHKIIDSGLVMFPSGHARNETCNLETILNNKFQVLGKIAVNDTAKLLEKMNSIDKMDDEELRDVYNVRITTLTALDKKKDEEKKEKK